MDGTSGSQAGGRRGHLCWVHRSGVGLRDQVRAFLSEGRAAGAQLRYIGAGDLRDLEDWLSEDPVLAGLLADGDLGVQSLDDVYTEEGVLEPAHGLAAYAAATRRALADGFTGLRVAAEATPLVRDPARRATFARYEHLIDGYMADHPFEAMCAYDADVLEPQAVAEIACLHPESSRGAAPFRWHADRRGGVVLAGEVDLSGRSVFEVTLARTLPLHPGGHIVVEAGALDFIDHRGLLALDAEAGRAGADVLLRTESDVVHRLAALLPLASVRVGWSR